MAANPKKDAITPARSSLAASATANPLAAALAGYDAKQYNLATPITLLDRVPPMHRVSVRVVTINPATETYQIPGSDKLGLGKTALDKIAAAAGIEWIPERSGQVDQYHEPHRVKYRATARVRDFDGRTRTVFAEKEIDLRGEPGWPDEQLGTDAREFARIAAKKSRDPWPQIFQQRQHVHSLAESKAKLRCVRAALGIPVALPPGEIGKPWVVPALVPDLDMSDPEIKRMMAASLIGSQAALYGPRELQAGATTPVLDEPEPDAVDVSDLEEAPEGETYPTEPVAPVQTTDLAEPWEGLDVAACPLPVDAEVIAKVSPGQTVRIKTLHRLNDIFAQVAETRGYQEARAVVAKTAPKFDPLTSPMDELASVGMALKAALGGGT